jgi:hypothetical protein
MNIYLDVLPEGLRERILSDIELLKKASEVDGKIKGDGVKSYTQQLISQMVERGDYNNSSVILVLGSITETELPRDVVKAIVDEVERVKSEKSKEEAIKAKADQDKLQRYRDEDAANLWAKDGPGESYVQRMNRTGGWEDR